ncbi:hypothetical protein DM01DRAFT_1332547 [Hesseltinella vesiculosa]|uniref:Arrestin C-terminal-like domain-containing protein n=1 Tax=Hesseltinella vesiculosa TaxID=101127 RepID=A0A1X2GTP8_9FUNG|nr:hypothetical protein DM01DRAFT_1332547 [Hesseltinella vesiculosa]
MLPYTLENVWDQCLHYRVQLNKRRFKRGEPIYVQITLRPLIPGLRVRHISSFLKEYVLLSPPPTDVHHHHHQAPLHESSRIVTFARNETLRSLSCQSEWKVKETLVIPRFGNVLHFDLDHPMIEVRHKAKFTICLLQESNGKKLDLRVTMPLDLVDAAASLPQPESDVSAARRSPGGLWLENLPPYEDACLSTPHYDTDWSATSPMDEVICTPPNNLVSHAQDYFSFQPSCGLPTIPLQRVPSYETAMRSPF